MKLNDVKILVTGSSRGLGCEVSKRFLYEGAHVVGFSRSQSDFCDDVREASSISNIANTKYDVLFLCAGVYGPIGPFETNSLVQWKDCIETNLMGVVNCCHVLIPEMKKRRSGKIIMVSGGGATRSRPNFSAYAVSKAAVFRLMETLSEELKPWNIDVNCMAPGLLGTTMHQSTIAAGIDVVGDEEYAKAELAVNTAVQFNKACDLAVWLASSDSNGITGKLISVHHDYRSITA